MAEFALRQIATGLIVNRIVLEVGADWTPPAGHDVIADDAAVINIGGTLVDDVYTPAETVPVPGPAPVRRVEQIGIVRFTVSANVISATADSIAIGGVQRISAGRYRIFYETPDTDVALLPSVSVRDAADVRARVTARTATYVEIRTVSSAGAAVDVAEVIVTLDKVIST